MNFLRKLFAKPSEYPSYPTRTLDDGTRCSHMSDIFAWQINVRRILAMTVPSLGYSTCHCCNLPWWVVEGHAISYANGSGCFPICESCWRCLGPEKAWPYYQAWIQRHYPEHEETLKNNVFGNSARAI